MIVGRINYFNNMKGYGFITVNTTEGDATVQQQFFFHVSNFAKHETPTLGGIVCFNLGTPIAEGKKIQAVGIRYATPQDVQQSQIAPKALAILSGTQEAQ
jgi:cold shock CspA family protein